MIEINFKFKEKNNIIKSETTTYFNDICEEFARNQSLDIEDLNIFYKGTKLNLEMNLFVGQQFELELQNLNENPEPIKIELLVFEEYPYQIKFQYEQNQKIVKIKKTEKVKDVLERYASQIGKDISELFFIYGGNSIPKELYNTAIYDIMNNNDKNKKLMNILVNDNNIENNSINSIVIPKEEENYESSNIPIENNKIDMQKILLDQNEEIVKLNEISIDLVEQSNDKNKFFLKIFIILIIQYPLILLFFFLGFFYKLNEILLEKFSIGYELTLVICIYAILSIIFNEILIKKTKKSIMIMILFFFSIDTIFFAFSLLNYIESKYIIIALTLITLNILSMPINSLFIKKYTFLFLCLISAIFSFIGLVIFCTLWIKSLLPIIFISLFWIFSIGYQICWFYFNMKYCRINELFYSSILYNMAICLVIEKGFSIIIKYINNYIQNKIKGPPYLHISVLKIFSILLVQNILIFIFVWISFILFWENKKINELIPLIGIILFLLYELITVILLKWFRNSKIICHILNIIYIPIMIIIYYIFQKGLEPEYVLSFLLTVIFGLLSIILFIFYTNKTHFLLLTVISLVSNAIFIAIFNFLWLKDEMTLKIQSIAFGLLNLGFCITYFFLDVYIDNYLISVLILDSYPFVFPFCIVFSPLFPCFIYRIKKDKNFCKECIK